MIVMVGVKLKQLDRFTLEVTVNHVGQNNRDKFCVFLLIAMLLVLLLVINNNEC